MSKGGKKKVLSVSYIAVPSQIISSLSSSSLFSVSPPQSKSNKSKQSWTSPRVRLYWWLWALFLLALLGMLLRPLPLLPVASPISIPYPCTHAAVAAEKQHFMSLMQGRSEGAKETMISIVQRESGGKGMTTPTPISSYGDDVDSGGSSDFWRQPDGMGYRVCLEFSEDYRRTSSSNAKRNKYLMVVVAGGINQQRNQIVDAVMIARILGAILVVPIFQVNVIWGDDSEFSDIFDLDHFKRVLANDVRIVSSLPSTHLRRRPVVERPTPLHVSAEWIRSHYLKRLEREGVLLLRGLDSRLSKDLPPDLQKLRCKVAFQALRFAPPILELGNKLAQRMQSKGPYLALHLRMEKDVWVRTGCLPGLSPKYDELVNSERKRHPELLTAKSNMTYQERKLAGLCPLNALEVARLLKALGAPKSARIYWAGGQPLGGKEALLPLTKEFPNFYSKEDLALPGELRPFANRASIMASIDYIICESSDVFMPSHGGNMGHALQGQRAFAGHKKYVTPNKRHMLPYFLNSSLPESEFNRVMRDLHRDSLGQPEIRTSKVGTGRDVTKYPIPECMCNSSTAKDSL